MRNTLHRIVAIAVGTLLGVQTLGGVALATPADSTPSLFSNELFQNGCTRDRQEQARAEAEGREPEDQEEANLQSWRKVFSVGNRHGAVPHHLCIFGDQLSPGEVDRRNR
jgi:hypothetical protein